MARLLMVSVVSMKNDTLTLCCIYFISPQVIILFMITKVGGTPIKTSFVNTHVSISTTNSWREPQRKYLLSNIEIDSLLRQFIISIIYAMKLAVRSVQRKLISKQHIYLSNWNAYGPICIANLVCNRTIIWRKIKYLHTGVNDTVDIHYVVYKAT